MTCRICLVIRFSLNDAPGAPPFDGIMYQNATKQRLRHSINGGGKK
jgi:hypothetical protein